MDKLESLGPYAHLSSEYRAFCESKVNLVKKCIDLAINTDLGELVASLDERELEELGLRFMIGDLEISAVSPPGSTSYVIVNYKGQRVLAGRHTSTDIELENGNLEYSEFVEIERFIPGAWEKQVDEFYTKHFNCQ